MAGYPTEGLRGATPEDLSWLIGNWEGTVDGDRVEEHWSPIRANTMMASFRWVAGGRVKFYELEVIEQDGDCVYQRIKHFDPGLHGWEERNERYELVLVAVSGDEAVFCETNQQDPRWVVYQRIGVNRLRAYFTRDRDPEPDPGVFELNRQEAN